MVFSNSINEHTKLLNDPRINSNDSNNDYNNNNNNNNNNNENHDPINDMYPSTASERWPSGVNKLDDLVAAQYVRNQCRLISRPWGKFNVVREHAASPWSRRLFRDLYHTLLDLPFWQVMTLVSLAFCFVNVVFALLYMAGGDSITDVDHRSFADNFFFSVQTIQTIGYGAMSPQTRYANSVMVVEAWLGTVLEAALVGLMFAKISRPTRIRRGVVFSKVAVVSPISSSSSKSSSLKSPPTTKASSSHSLNSTNTNEILLTEYNNNNNKSNEKKTHHLQKQKLVLRIANTRRTQLCEAKFSLLLVDNGYRFCHDDDADHVAPATSSEYESCIPIKQSQQSSLRKMWEKCRCVGRCIPNLRPRSKRRYENEDQSEVTPPVYITDAERRAASTRVHMYDGHRKDYPIDPYFSDIRIHELNFDINEQTGRTRDMNMSSPLLPLPWTVSHVIDEESPLYGITKEEFVRRDYEIVAVLEGIDEGCSDNIQARWSYKPHEIVWNAKFAPMIRRDQEQPYIIDFSRFSQVEPIEGDY